MNIKRFEKRTQFLRFVKYHKQHCYWFLFLLCSSYREKEEKLRQSLEVEGEELKLDIQDNSSLAKKGDRKI